MKKIIFTLVAIMMVSMSSVSMASNKGGYDNGNRHEMRADDYEYYRNRENRNDDNRRYEDSRDNNYRNNRDREEWNREDENRENNRDYRYNEREHCHKNNDSKVVGTILGAAALIILATSH
jgi:hypothetical protein